MNTKKLRQKILDLAIHGKLVAQNPNDEPASELLKRINPKAEIISNSEQYEKLPNGWCLTKTKNVFLINPKNKIDDALIAGFIPMASIKEGFCNNFTYEEREWNKIKNGFTHFADGDIAVAKISPCLENRKSVVLNNLPNKIGAGTTELHVFRPLCTTSLFGLWFFKSDYFINSCTNTFNGVVGQQRVGKNIIENLIFPLPPLEEQKRIVEAIDKWFALIDSIENNKADLETTIKQTKSKILDLAIHGKLVAQNPNDEPASELLKRINPKAEIISNSEQYKNLPNGWCLTLYKNIVKNVNSKAYQILQSEIKVNGKHPVISQSSNYIEGYSNCTEKVFQCKEAIIFGDHTRNVKFINFPFIVGADGVKILQTQFDYKYIYYFTIFSSDNLIEDKGYSRHFGQLSSLEIPLPPLEEQKRIVEAIDKAFKYLDAIAESL